MIKKSADVPAANEVDIENLFGVERLRFKTPEKGGLVVLLGDNGEGKSNSLQALNATLGGPTDVLQKRDRTAAGRVSAFGVTIRVGQSSRRSGELLVKTLEDQLTIADIVDPKVKDPAAADMKRLKALLRVSGAEADPSQFYSLFADSAEAKEKTGDDISEWVVAARQRFHEIVSQKTIAETDLVAMAAGIKADIERAAREREAEVQDLLATIKAKRAEIADVDLAAPSDEATLQAELEAALKAEQQLRFQANVAASQQKATEEAQAKLAEASATYTGPTREECREAAELLMVHRKSSLARIEVLKQQLALEEQNYQQLDAQFEKACLVEQAAISHFNMLESWRQQIGKTQTAAPSEADIAAAAERLQKARQAQQNGAIVRRAIERKVQADLLEAEAKEAQQAAEQLRAAAKGTEGVLSDIVRAGGGAIKVIEGEKGEMRLAVDLAKRGMTYLAELSVGEKWDVALPIAIEAVGPGGAFVIPQEAFEGLSPRNRKRLVERLVGSEVTAFTALPQDGDLRAVICESAEDVPASAVL